MKFDMDIDMNKYNYKYMHIFKIKLLCVDYTILSFLLIFPHDSVLQSHTCQESGVRNFLIVMVRYL